MTFRELLRIFKITSFRSSHIGQPGYDKPEDWQHFFEKYRESCITILRVKYPQFKNDAEDAWMMAVEDIKRDWKIVNRKPDDSFRAVLTNICIKFMRRLHNPHRAPAIRKHLTWLRVRAQAGSLKSDPLVMKRVADIIRFIRNDLLDPNYQNGRYFKHLKAAELDLWRFVQQSDLSDTDLSIQLGVPYKRLNRAKNNIDQIIIDEAIKIAKDHEILDEDFRPAS